jgi:hypothetical protein
MKKILFFSFLLFTGILPIMSQDLKARLLAIDQQCQKIREKGFTRVDTILFECPDRPDYGTVRYYSNQNKLSYIEIEGSDQSHCDYFNFYYLADDHPIYCRTHFGCWSFTGEAPEDSNSQPATAESYYERIYYAEAGHAIYCTEQTYTVPSDSIGLVSSDDYAFVETDCVFFEEFVRSDLLDLMSIYEQKKKSMPDCIFDLVPEK